MEGQVPPLFDITPERRDEMIEDLAQRITKAGMGTPALLFLEAHKPLGRLAGNALHLFSPMLGVFLPSIDQYGYLLQDPQNLEILIMRLQEIEEERGRQQRALRAERKARAQARKMRAGGLDPWGRPPESGGGAESAPPAEGGGAAAPPERGPEQG